MQNIEEIEQQITIATLTVFEQVKWDEYIYIMHIICIPE